MHLAALGIGWSNLLGVLLIVYSGRDSIALSIAIMIFIGLGSVYLAVYKRLTGLELPFPRPLWLYFLVLFAGGVFLAANL